MVCKRIQTEGQADLRLQGFGPLVRGKCQSVSRTGGCCKAGLRVRGEKSGHLPGFREGKLDRPCSRGHWSAQRVPSEASWLGALAAACALRGFAHLDAKVLEASFGVGAHRHPCSQSCPAGGWRRWVTLPQALGPVVWGLRLATLTLLGSQGPCVPHLRARPPCPLPGEPVSMTVSAH